MLYRVARAEERSFASAACGRFAQDDNRIQEREEERGEEEKNEERSFGSAPRPR